MRIGLALVALALASLPSGASAFRLGETYAEPAIEGGGGERWFTGSSSDGHTCAVCHRGADAPMIELTGLPELGYVPGETYEIEVPLPDTTTASATVEFVDAVGAGAGSLGLPSPSAPDLCAAVGSDPPAPAASTATTRKGRQIAAVDGCGADRLLVRWTAPAQTRGPIWVHAAIVAADGSGDPEGDGVRILSRLIPSYGGGGEAIRVGSPGCSAGTADRSAPLGAALLVIALVFVRRRRAPGLGIPPRRAQRARRDHSESPLRALRFNSSIPWLSDRRLRPERRRRIGKGCRKPGIAS